jgi:hypothetical protein
MATVGLVLLGIVAALGLVGVVARLRVEAQHRAFQAAVVAYARSKGGTVEWLSPQRIRVKGPLGGGEESTTAMEIMCRASEPAKWSHSIGFCLRKYIPDAFDETFARMAKERLAAELPKLDALAPAELNQRLRVKIFSKRTDAVGLSTAAVAIDERHEARVVLDGVDLAGIPTSVRARLPDSDEQLVARALGATLGAPPDFDIGAAAGHTWLVQPKALWGGRPAVVVGEGKQLSWLPAQPAPATRALIQLASRSLNDGPLKGCMWLWNGERLASIGVVQHTLIGPTTPDYTLTMQPETAAVLGLTLDARGAVGVRAAR